MKSRVIASVAVSALVVLGTTACTFITPQASTIQYSQSDGINVQDNDGPVVVRNAFIVTNEDGTLGNLVAALVNTSNEDATLRIQADGMAKLQIDVEAKSAVSLGTEDMPPLLLNDPMSSTDVSEGAFTAGTNVKVFFQSGDATGTAAEIPVLDGTLPYYEDLVPDEAALEEDDNLATPAPSN